MHIYFTRVFRYNKLQMDGDVHEDIKDILKIQQNDTKEHNKVNCTLRYICIHITL